MRVTAGFVLAVAVLSAAAPVAAAQDRTPEEWASQHAFDGDGHPLLDSFFDPGTSGLTFIEWRTCPPSGSPCSRLPSTPPRSLAGGTAAPGETPPGTSFEAAYRRDGAEVTVRTPPWTGRVTMTSPPAVIGDAVVGQRVTMRGASWAGGWAGAPSSHSHGDLVVCPEPTGGSGCWGIDGTLEERWAEYYLLARDLHHPDGLMEVQGWPVPPYPVTGTIEARGTHLERFSAPVQVRPAPIPVVAPQPKAPSVTLRARALRTKGRISVGRVTCAVSCRVAVKVSGGGRRAYRTTFVATGTKAITAPTRRGTLTVRVHVDGRLIKAGRVAAR